MKQPLKILILEDSKIDAEILTRLLSKEKTHYEFHLAMNEKSFLAALDDFFPDVILSDNSLPGFNAADALRITRQRYHHTPFILVTGTVSEEYAATIIKEGADDYILKDRLARLPAAINSALKQRRVEKEKQEAIEKLIQSEEKYRTIFLKSPLPKWIYDYETLQFLEVNDAAIRHYGYSKEEFLSMTIKDIRPAEDVELLLNDLDKIKDTPDSRHGAWKHVKKSGELILVETTAHSIEYNNRKARMVVINDITEKLAAEQQREFDSHNLKALINNTKDLMWSVDRDLKLITFNDSFNEVITYMSGQPLVTGRDILSTHFTDDQLKRYKIYYDRALQGESFTITDHFDGPVEIWAEISFYPIRKADEVIGTACFSRDVTERKKMDEQLKIAYVEKQALAERMSAIINTLPANIALLDEEGIIVDVNDSWRNFADNNGFIGSNYCIGDNYLTISMNASGIDEMDGKKVAAGINAVLKNKIKDFEFEYSCHSPELKRWFRMVATPLEEKEYAGAVVMHIDISELRRLEEERLESKMAEQKKIARAMLTGQEKERNRIAQELHDNVNQILAGTKMFLSIAGNKNETVKESVKYPMELIDNSIEEIRLLCNKLVTPLKNIDLEELIRDLLGKLDENKITKTKFTYAVPAELLSDDVKLNTYRIIQEQVNNILKYAEAKNVIISITAQDKILSINLEDDGKGFDTSSKRKGIGISNMINRAETFNGKVKIKTSPGNGCKINITIPY